MPNSHPDRFATSRNCSKQSSMVKHHQLASMPETNESDTEFESDGQQEGKQKVQQQDLKTIKIFDRFSIILQIFAKRGTFRSKVAKTTTAKLQIELNFLQYLKTKLMRAEGSTYSPRITFFVEIS
jgi:50S ribosomal subunit-associated GTPase HflX